MLKAYLALVLLAAAAFAESVRETETWMPIKPGHSPDDLVSSGDFGFPDEDSPTPYDEDDDDDDDDDDDVDYDKEDYDYFSGSGDEDVLFDKDLKKMPQPEEFDNSIPDIIPSAKPLPTEDSNDIKAVRNNEIMRAYDPSVSQSHTGEHNIFKKTEVLAAVIAGGAVGLLFAVLLILLLVYRMKKKDEGSYDLGKKPIYKKAPTAEIYA